MTSPVPPSSKRWSLEHTSAYALFGNVQRMWSDLPDGGDAARTRLRDAVLAYSVSGTPQTMDKDAHDLIKFGLCAFDAEGSNIILGEPLIVEAALHKIGLRSFVTSKLAASSTDAGASGNNFEVFSLPFIRSNFVNALHDGKFGVASDEMGDGWTPLSTIGLSSYGVLALSTDTPAKTMQWLEDSIASTVEGDVPPFCFPDQAMGPDLLFLLRHESSWGTWKLCMWQHKFKNVANQAEALRTINQDLLFFVNRDKPSSKLGLASSAETERWTNLRAKLFKDGKRKRGVMTVLLEYPAGATKSSQSKVSRHSEGEGVDVHVTIAGDANVVMFEAEGVEFLNSVKNNHSSTSSLK